MSKTSQRKREYFNQGLRDQRAGYPAFPPFILKQHVFNRAYLDGYAQGERDNAYRSNDSVLQWFRVTFGMASA